MKNAGAKILVFQYGENPFVSRMWMKGLVRYARTVRWQIETVAYSRDDIERQYRTAREIVRYHQPDGVVGSCFERLSRDVLADVPCVWLDAPAEKVPAGDSLVFHDGAVTGEMAAKEFLKLGFRRFAVVADQLYRTWSTKRVAEFRRIVEKAGGSLNVLRLMEPAVDRLASMRRIEPWLRRLQKPCGVFGVNDLIASEVLSVANRIGGRVPEDIAVIGVDNNEDICTLTTPPLTSIATDWEKGGYLAAEELDRIMRNPKAKPRRIPFGELGIVRRASSSPCEVRVDPRVAAASLFIREHACEGIGVDDVVRQMGCSRRLATMRYLEATGHSIFAEIREAQFEQVLVLLAQRDVQLGAIADRCGWRSPTALRAYFEKRLGMTMREWRARNAAS